MPIVKYQSKTASTAHDGPVLPSSYLHGAVERINALGNNQVVATIATDDTTAAKVANEDKNPRRGPSGHDLLMDWQDQPAPGHQAHKRL